MPNDSIDQHGYNGSTRKPKCRWPLGRLFIARISAIYHAQYRTISRRRAIPSIGIWAEVIQQYLSIDTQGIIQNNDALYRSWFELERFGLVLFKKLTGTYLYNNALASFTMVVFFGMSAVVWAYFLCSASRDTKLQPAFFMIPYVVSPIFAEMLGFLLQGPEISIAAVLTAISLMMWANAATNRSIKRRIPLVIAAIVCATISFTMYLAMVTIFITGTAMLYVLRFGSRAQWDRQKKSSWIFDRQHSHLRCVISCV